MIKNRLPNQGRCRPRKRRPAFENLEARRVLAGAVGANGEEVPAYPTYVQRWEGVPEIGEVSNQFLSEFTITISEELDPNTVNDQTVILTKAGVDRLFDTTDDVNQDLLIRSYEGHCCPRRIEAQVIDADGLFAGIADGLWRLRIDQSVKDTFGRSLSESFDSESTTDPIDRIFEIDVISDGDALLNGTSNSVEHATPLIMQNDAFGTSLFKSESGVGFIPQSSSDTPTWSLDVAALKVIAIDQSIGSRHELLVQDGTSLEKLFRSGLGQTSYRYHYDVSGEDEVFIQLKSSHSSGYTYRVDVIGSSKESFDDLVYEITAPGSSTGSLHSFDYRPRDPIGSREVLIQGNLNLRTQQGKIPYGEDRFDLGKLPSGAKLDLQLRKPSWANFRVDMEVRGIETGAIGQYQVDLSDGVVSRVAADITQEDQYYVRVIGYANLGVTSVYQLDGIVQETIAPNWVDIIGLPESQTDEVATTNEFIDSFEIRFDERIVFPEDPSLIELREGGDDGLLNTMDDVVVLLERTGYGNSEAISSQEFQFHTHGRYLADGIYQLKLGDQLTDVGGNPIANGGIARVFAIKAIGDSRTHAGWQNASPEAAVQLERITNDEQFGFDGIAKQGIGLAQSGAIDWWQIEAEEGELLWIEVMDVQGTAMPVQLAFDYTSSPIPSVLQNGRFGDTNRWLIRAHQSGMMPIGLESHSRTSFTYYLDVRIAKSGFIQPVNLFGGSVGLFALQQPAHLRTFVGSLRNSSHSAFTGDEWNPRPPVRQEMLFNDFPVNTHVSVQIQASASNVDAIVVQLRPAEFPEIMIIEPGQERTALFPTLDEAVDWYLSLRTQVPEVRENASDVLSNRYNDYRVTMEIDFGEIETPIGSGRSYSVCTVSPNVFRSTEHLQVSVPNVFENLDMDGLQLWTAGADRVFGSSDDQIMEQSFRRSPNDFSFDDREQELPSGNYQVRYRPEFGLLARIVYDFEIDRLAPTLTVTTGSGGVSIEDFRTFRVTASHCGLSVAERDISLSTFEVDQDGWLVFTAMRSRSPVTVATSDNVSQFALASNSIDEASALTRINRVDGEPPIRLDSRLWTRHDDWLPEEQRIKRTRAVLPRVIDEQSGPFEFVGEWELAPARPDGTVHLRAGEFPLVFRTEFPNHNPFLAGDVNHDGSVTPLDALLIINTLNLDSAQPSGSFTDVSSDGVTSALDALQVINWLNDPAVNQEPASASGQASVNQTSPAVVIQHKSRFEQDENFRHEVHDVVPLF